MEQFLGISRTGRVFRLSTSKSGIAERAGIAEIVMIDLDGL